MAPREDSDEETVDIGVGGVPVSGVGVRGVLLVPGGLGSAHPSRSCGQLLA